MVISMFVFNIKKYMLEKNVSVEEIIKATRMSKQTIQDIIDNKTHDVSLSIIYKISKILNVKMEKLYHNIDEYEELREKLNKVVDVFGVNDRRAKELSEILDYMHNLKIRNNMIS